MDDGKKRGWRFEPMVIATYKHKRDNQTVSKETSWASLSLALSKFRETADKDGKLWSPAQIDGPRRDENVQSVHALVLDFDDGHDWTDFLEAWKEWAFLVHTTYSHTPEKPKWRAVFPLEQPVPGSEWEDLYRRLSFRLGRGCNDTTCCNPARIYYLPSHPPGGEHFYYANEGRPLRASDAVDLTVSPATGTRPGDDYNSRPPAWDTLLTPHGWRHCKGNTWTRPGKEPRDGCSAIADDIFYCWSSNAGIPANKAMTPFALYTWLNFGGDYSAAARELRKQGYGGGPVQAVSSSIIADIAESDSEYAASPYSEAGNGARFAKWVEPRVRYAVHMGKWLEWDGRRWQPDDKGGGSAIALVKEWAALLRAEAASIVDADARKRAWAFACGLDKKEQVEKCLFFARTNKAIACLPDELDTQKHLICVENGVFNLDRMKLEDHNPALLMTKLAPVRYSSFASCPNWEAFLLRFLPDAEIRDYLQKVAGYSLTGYTGERKFFFLYGALGGNGKSTVFAVLSRVLGDYCANADPETFMLKDKGNSASNDLARLAGARLVLAAEQEDGHRLAESLVKRITGNDPITARFLHKEFFEFYPEFTLMMMGNHKPTIKGTDDAIWDRVGLIPFNYSLPVEERRPNFADSFTPELSGIFKWMLDGYERYKSEGLQSPKGVQEAVQEYRTDSDVLGAFLESCTERDSFGSVKSSELYGVYTRWSKVSGQGTLSHTAFTKRMKERGFDVQKGERANEFMGLTVTNSMEQSETYRRHWCD